MRFVIEWREVVARGKKLSKLYWTKGLVSRDNVNAIAMEDHADETEALLSMAKESMQALLESQEETKKQDNRMVEKVNDLDEQIKKLSDELGRKVSVDELEEFAGIT